jgi:hypothetical protein
METRNFIALILTVVVSLSCLGQLRRCDSVAFNYIMFDKKVKKDLASTKFDTILTIHHCPMMQSCHDNSVLLMCWKHQGKFYFKKYTVKNGKVQFFQEIPIEIKEKLKVFFLQNFIENEKKLEDDKITTLVDGGPDTVVVCKSKDFCWAYEYFYKINSPVSRWTQELLELIK